MSLAGILKTFGIGSDKEMDTLQQVLPYMKPAISPWWTLGIGAGLGILQNENRHRDRERSIALNAKLAAIPQAYMGGRQVPIQYDHAKPDAFSDIMAGIGTAKGTIDDLNQYSAAVNIYDELMKKDAKDALPDATLQGLTPEQQDMRNVGAMGEDPYIDPTLDTAPVQQYLQQGYPYTQYTETTPMGYSPLGDFAQQIKMHNEVSAPENQIGGYMPEQDGYWMPPPQRLPLEVPDYNREYQFVKQPPY